MMRIPRFLAALAIFLAILLTAQAGPARAQGTDPADQTLQPPAQPASEPPAAEPAEPADPPAAAPSGDTAKAPAGPETAPEPWRALIDEGRQLESSGKWLDALRSYRRALRTAPEASHQEIQDAIETATFNFGVETRYQDAEFVQESADLNSKKGLRLLREILERLKLHYYREVEVSSMVGDGLDQVGRVIRLPGVAGAYPKLAVQGAVESLEKKIDEALRSLDLEPDMELGDCLALVEGLLDAAEREGYPSGALVHEILYGALDGLDPYTLYMNPEETDRFYKGITGRYAGIGAYVDQRGDDKVLTIVSPIYSGPAYKVGLRSGDQVLSIGGKSTIGRKLDDLVQELRGTAGTEVLVTVLRPGWPDPKDFTITRADIRIETVQSTQLPGKIGYIRMIQFNSDTPRELDEAIAQLRRGGTEAIVLDLRSNPGGYLDAAVEVVDRLVEAGELVVYSQGRHPGVAGRTEYKTTRREKETGWPIAVLVDGGSASASEIVSGALRDHKRGVLVGERTFGKGSVQKLYKLAALQGKAELRATVALYYLPAGQCIDKIGIEPDLTVEAPRYEDGQGEEAVKVRQSGKIESWIAEQWTAHEELLARLAESDGMDHSRYPGFEEFYAALGTALPREEVRRLVRVALRRRIADAAAHELPADFQEDPQLQQGIGVVLKRLDRDPASIPEYAPFLKVSVREGGQGEGSGAKHD